MHDFTHYVEAYRDPSCQEPILGNLDGQAALRSAEVDDYWRYIVMGPRLPFRKVCMWRLVTASGRFLKQWRNASTPDFKKGNFYA